MFLLSNRRRSRWARNPRAAKAGSWRKSVANGQSAETSGPWSVVGGQLSAASSQSGSSLSTTHYPLATITSLPSPLSTLASRLSPRRSRAAAVEHIFQTDAEVMYNAPVDVLTDAAIAEILETTSATPNASVAAIARNVGITTAALDDNLSTNAPDMTAMAAPKESVPPVGQFTVTMERVTVHDPGQILQLGQSAVGYTVTYTPPKDYTVPAGYRIVLVQAIKVQGFFTGTSPEMDVEKDKKYDHKLLPPYPGQGGPASVTDRPNNPWNPGGGSTHEATICAVAQRIGAPHGQGR